MCCIDQFRCYGGQWFYNGNEHMRKNRAADKFLYESPCSQPAPKLLLPSFFVLQFHLPARNFVFEKKMNLFKANLACMQSHTHTIAAERCDHAGRVAYHNYMIVDLTLF